MKKQKQFCTFCGKSLSKNPIEGKIRDYCPHCQSVFYENPLPVASSIVVNENREVLLVKRKKDPYKDMWCLPIGFAETEEEVRDAALRELKEETGVWGHIIRLIDVDTVDNYYYGYLAIVTYEVMMTSGTLSAGDDALDAKFFPITDRPSLAWSSNEKALQIYIDLHKDTWSMIDSFKYLFPEADSIEDVMPRGRWQEKLLSNVLVQIIDKDINEINDRWTEEMAASLPRISDHLNLFLETNIQLLHGLQFWLRRDYDSLDLETFIEKGASLCQAGVPLPEMLMAMSLSRKSIWQHIVKKKLLSSPLEIYTTLELNNRIIYFYDKVNYYLTMTYDDIVRRHHRVS